MALDTLRARRAIFLTCSRRAELLSSRRGRPNRLTRGVSAAWAATAVLAALTTGCFGSVAAGPDEYADAASVHAEHEASTTHAHEAGSDARGHRDAARTGDARVGATTVDATVREASSPVVAVDATVREASSPVDAGAHDATQHVEAMAEAGRVDAGHDSTATDAGDADAAPVCTHPDVATGTIDTLAQDPGLKIEDFDIDSANVFFTTTAGAILSCPASGCTAAPTTISESIPSIDDGGAVSSTFLVRIGLNGLVFAQTGSTPAAPGRQPAGHLNLYTLGRDGSGVTLLQHTEDGSFWEAVQRLAVAGSEVFYVASEDFGAETGVWLEAVLPADGGVASATNQVGLGSYGHGPPRGYGDVALVGSVAYAGAAMEWEEPYPIAAFSALADGGAAAPVYANPPVLAFSTTSFAASSGFIACAGEVRGDGGVEVIDAGQFNGVRSVDAGGAYALFVCAAGGVCKNPTKVAGVNAKTIQALYADTTTLYFTDTANNLFSCDAAAALAGSCAPTLLACPAPAFTELRSDRDHVYLLKSDGSAIVRIAR